jgi:hypothetical protein
MTLTGTYSHVEFHLSYFDKLGSLYLKIINKICCFVGGNKTRYLCYPARLIIDQRRWERSVIYLKANKIS